jgi:hypothetical protein
MSNSIENKSAATLIDELITAEIKLWVFRGQGTAKAEAVDGVLVRCHKLIDALDKALGAKGIGAHISKLACTNIECFMAQESLFAHSKADEKVEAGEAGMRVHHLNAERNNCIRAIDTALGFGDVTQLPKTYE